MAATVTLTYQIPRNAQSEAAQRQVIEETVLDQGELLALGLVKVSDVTTASTTQISRVVIMRSPFLFQQQFPTDRGQRSAVAGLFLGRLQRLSMAGITQTTAIAIS